MLKALAMLKELNNSSMVVSKIIDEKNFSLNLGPIEISQEFINSKIGKEINPKEVLSILESLGFEVKKLKDKYSLTIPTWRATKDISIKEDIIEEIARIYGYNNITPQFPVVVLDTPKPNLDRMLERKAKNLLVGFGIFETLNYSFVGENLLTKMGINIANHIKLKNYPSEDYTMLRKSLIPNLIKSCSQNLKNTNKIKMFELGRVFATQLGRYKEDREGKTFLPKQDKYLSAVFSVKDNWEPFYEAKGIVESLLENLQFDFQITSLKEPAPYMHPKRSAEVIIDDEQVGVISEIHPKTALEFDLNQKVGFFELNFTKLSEIYSEKSVYQPLNKFPSLDLDLSVVVDEIVLWKDVLDIVNKEAKELIKNIELFDVYKGDKIQAGKKSLAFRIVYQAEDRTLEMDEVLKIQDKIIFQLGKKLGAVIRK